MMIDPLEIVSYDHTQSPSSFLKLGLLTTLLVDNFLPWCKESRSRAGIL
jgi:hypothetical protein